MTNDTTPLWRREFPADYDVPAVLTNDPELIDNSWHNDTHPSFVVRGTEDGEKIDVRLWADHPVAAEREANLDLQEDNWVPRFAVCDHRTDDTLNGTLYHGDDVVEAVRILKATVAALRAAQEAK